MIFFKATNLLKNEDQTYWVDCICFQPITRKRLSIDVDIYEWQNQA